MTDRTAESRETLETHGGPSCHRLVINHLRTRWKLDPLPVKSLERKNVWSSNERMITAWPGELMIGEMTIGEGELGRRLGKTIESIESSEAEVGGRMLRLCGGAG
jgi:hypothetical protein